MKAPKILVSQPKPAIIEKSPFCELSRKYNVEIVYQPFIHVEKVSLKEFRSQRIEVLEHTAVIFTSKTTVDSFFQICKEARISVPESMKYICQTETVALYLQKYITYRKRKISFGDGSFTSLLELLVKHKEEKFLLTLSLPHRPELPETLAKLQLSVDSVILARTVATDLKALTPSEYTLMALYSPSDVKALIEQFPSSELPPIAVFGEGTLRTALDAGLPVRANAPTPQAPSMVKAVDIYLDKWKKGEETAPVEMVVDERKEEFLRTQEHRLSKRNRQQKAATAPKKSSPATTSKKASTSTTKKSVKADTEHTTELKK